MGAPGGQHVHVRSLAVCAADSGLLLPRAGITSTLAMFPLETVRTRLAVDHDKYRGVLTAFRTILHAEGFPALYRVRPP